MVQGKAKNAKRARSNSSTVVRKRNLTSYKVPVSWASFRSPSGAAQGMAGPLKVRLIYSSAFTLSPGAISAANVFALNGLYDPDITGAGHQPAGFDQYMAMFETYNVLACKYKVTMINSSGTVYPIQACTVSDYPTPPSDPRQYLEAGNTEWKVSGKIGTNCTAPEIVEFSGFVDIAKGHGITQNELKSSPSYKGNASANPTEGLYLHVWSTDSQFAGGNLATQYCDITLEYYVIFQGGKINALS